MEGKKASFTIEVHPEWAPLGAERFAELVATPGFFDGVRFFRVVKGFMAQFGIPAKPAMAKEWKDKKITCVRAQQRAHCGRPHALTQRTLACRKKTVTTPW